MWDKQKVSVVFPAYNEENYVGKAVKDFLATKVRIMNLL
ncbi:MAG: hypothetical protein MAG795_00093 [Candidatus Woesearchaeota archaeon]|nr:hypothetical protein [Candidatus Woesearchaeota archaeon]